MPADIKTAIEVAIYLLDKSNENGHHLQPQKLQRLLYLAQAYYASAYNRKLMPAVFVADELGPVEPNIYIAFSRGKPDIDLDSVISEKIKFFLDKIWDHFGAMNIEKLDTLTKKSAAYRKAEARGIGAEINFSDIQTTFTKRSEINAIAPQKKPRLLRNQNGVPVEVTKWKPKKQI